ncbi:MAG: hypothetical protein WC480_00595 [Patescibacteria group bacterium]
MRKLFLCIALCCLAVLMVGLTVAQAAPVQVANEATDETPAVVANHQAIIFGLAANYAAPNLSATVDVSPPASLVNVITAAQSKDANNDVAPMDQGTECVSNDIAVNENDVNSKEIREEVAAVDESYLSSLGFNSSVGIVTVLNC